MSYTNNCSWSHQSLFNAGAIAERTSAADLYSVEASDLGWEPGFWPAAITVDGVRLSQGVADAGGRTIPYTSEDEFVVVYIYND